MSKLLNAQMCRFKWPLLPIQYSHVSQILSIASPETRFLILLNSSQLPRHIIQHILYLGLSITYSQAETHYLLPAQIRPPTLMMPILGMHKLIHESCNYICVREVPNKLNNSNVKFPEKSYLKMGMIRQVGRHTWAGNEYKTSY